ncbi:MAG: oxidoreductase [Bacteroidetes bacterium CG23_combo_of_CG06-09_8_20_14_all_32_9]|nr:MAG: oxidoreductase [Bacteroidetes bacterium CG23_combo_of_CG06-09_8_20_14_all_32_9]
MQKIGIIGVGHFGRSHIKELKEIPEFELAGFYDINPETSKQISAEFNISVFSSYEELLNEVNVVDIAVPTSLHYECAVEAIKKQKHVFIENPVTLTVEDAENLIKLAEEASIKVQVGNIEQFNPAFRGAQLHINNPVYIEIQRLQPFTNSSPEDSVILNLMIYDIDIILGTVNANIKKIDANGAKFVSGTADIANARLEFDNGCVANITSSRISPDNIVIYKFFQKDEYIIVDFLNKKTETVKFKKIENNCNPVLNNYRNMLKELLIENYEITNSNALKEEFLAFSKCIENNSTPLVTLDDGFKALQVANEIIEKINI